MSEQRHPDIEIYIKNTSIDSIILWLTDMSDTLLIEHQQANHTALSIHFGSHQIQADLHQKVSGKAWSSLWIKSSESPWATDLDCALNAAQKLETQVRCMANSWRENEDEKEMWWRVEGEEKSLIEWDV